MGREDGIADEVAGNDQKLISGALPGLGGGAFVGLRLNSEGLSYRRIKLDYVMRMATGFP